jgi:tRNA (cmo5U34)-methyltransferase
MSSKADNFDGIAPWYDFLVKLVFGKSVKHAQELFLDRLPQTGHVLIVGGGTGWIVESLLKVQPLHHVTFIEASAKMLKIAQQRLRDKSDRVTFVHGTDENIPLGVLYDGIITNFFLDLFLPKGLNVIIHRLKKHLKTDGYWIATDFVATQWWHRVFLRTMYLFFRFTSNIRARQLPPWHKTLTENGVKEISSAAFYGGFIVTKLYRISE